MNRLGNYFSNTANQEINQFKTLDEECYHIEFENKDEREVNPCKLRHILNKKRKQQIEKLKTDSRNGFSFKVEKTGTKNKLRNLNNFEDSLCKISFRSFIKVF